MNSQDSLFLAIILLSFVVVAQYLFIRQLKRALTDLATLISQYLVATANIIPELEALELRNAYLESQHCHDREVTVASIMHRSLVELWQTRQGVDNVP